MIALLLAIGIIFFFYKTKGVGAACAVVFTYLMFGVAAALGVPWWAIFIMSLWSGVIINRWDVKGDNPEPKI